MISYPQPNKATTKRNDKSHPIPPVTPNNATTTIPPLSSQLENGQQIQRLYENASSGRPPAQGRRGNWWQRLSLRTKATAVAIALGILPVLTIEAFNYISSSKEIRQDAFATQESLAIALGDKIGHFMFERHGDIQILRNLRAFTDPNLRQTLSRQEKEAQLKRFQEVYGVYDSIGVFDLNGNVIAKAGGELGRNSQGQITNNIKDRDHFQAVLKTDRTVISQPSVSKTTGKASIFLAGPVKDITTGKTIAVVRTRMPLQVLEELLQSEETQKTQSSSSLAGVEYRLVDASGKFVLAEKKNQVGRNARTDFSSFTQMQAANRATSAINFDQFDQDEEIISYAPVFQPQGIPELNLSILLSEDTDVAFAAQRRLLQTLLLGTGLTALIIGLIAAYLANRATRPIAAAAGAVERLGQGELDTRIRVQGQDEIAVLGSNINRMAGQIQNLLVEQKEASRQQLIIQEQAARQQTENAAQQKLAKEQLQKRALELLMEVDPISRGDLTIRASVTEDEIGTLADSYNATVESLRKIVTQVQTAAQKMATTTDTSATSVQELSTEALRQTEEIAVALDRIQEMSNSIRAVAKSAEQAEVAVQQANQTVEAGEAAMNRTVDGILAIRETVADTSTKVQRLGEASQRISKVVNLIGRFAAQTNLLALKASIEAARAGEEGRGFAILADEVRMLASQSAQATTEIESLVAAIQTETNEVAAAMEAGTEQVVEGTRLVNETRQSLNNITAASAQIGALVEAIASAAVVQSQTSESVTQTMSGVAAISNQTSNEATQVSASFKELLEVAQELQASAAQFKVI